MARSSVLVIAGRPNCEWTDRIAAAIRRLDAAASRLADAAAVAVILTTETGTTGPATVSESTDGELEEIAGALRSSLPVVPVLAGRAFMRAESLPVAVRDLAFRKGLELPTEAEIHPVAARLVATALTAKTPDPRLSATDSDHSANKLRKPTSETYEPASVFISYRRDDSALWAEKLARELAVRLGQERVYFDVGDVAPGIDFRHRIRDAIQRSSLFVLVIGPGFLERDGRGERRIDRDNDVVRFEIRSALERSVIPGLGLPDAAFSSQHLAKRIVCVGGAVLPSAQQLPEDIAALAEWQQPQGSDVAAVADDLIAAATLWGRRALPPGLSAFKMPWRSTGGWQEEERRRDTRCETALARLVELGWVEEPWSGVGVVRLVHPLFPRHRMLVYSQPQQEMKLEERSRTRRWEERGAFSLSSLRRDAYTTGLGDRAVEAAVNPERFLERLDPKIAFYSDAFRLEGAPHSTAAAPYQRTRRLVAAIGGVPELRHERSLGRLGRAPARALSFDPRGGVIAVATDRTLEVVDTKTWSVTSTCGALLGWRAVDISTHGWIAVGSDQGHLLILDDQLTQRVDLPARVMKKYRAHGGWLTSISWSSTGDQVAAAIGRTVLVVAITSGDVHQLPFPERPVGLEQSLQARFISGSSDLLVADGRTELSVVDAVSGEVRATLTTAPGQAGLSPEPASGLWLDIESIAVSADGGRVAFAGSDGQIAVARRTGLEVTDLFVWTDPAAKAFLQVLALAFSPDGGRLATITNDHQLIVGDLATGTPIGVASLPGPDDDCYVSPCVGWSPDSTHLAAVSFGGTIEFWAS